jgi:hypothetical protein
VANDALQGIVLIHIIKDSIDSHAIFASFFVDVVKELSYLHANSPTPVTPFALPL